MILASILWYYKLIRIMIQLYLEFHDYFLWLPCSKVKGDKMLWKSLRNRKFLAPTSIKIYVPFHTYFRENLLFRDLYLSYRWSHRTRCFTILFLIMTSAIIVLTRLCLYYSAVFLLQENYCVYINYRHRINSSFFTTVAMFICTWQWTEG